MDRLCKYDGAGPEPLGQDSGPFLCSGAGIMSAVKTAYRRIPHSTVKIEPEPPPVCRMFARCEGCPYPAHGFVCWGPDEGCIRSEMQKIALEGGGVRYRKEDAACDSGSAALDRVTAIAKVTAEYMSQMETVPQLTASGLTGDYRLLADFNGTVLAGHPTQYGVQFITWERVQNRTALYQGNYHSGTGKAAAGCGGAN